MHKGTTPAVTWWIEFENGGRSKSYASEPEAWAALTEFQDEKPQTSLFQNLLRRGSQSRAAALVSSDGLRFAIPMKPTG